MKYTVKNIFEDSRYDMACTYIIECMGETEVFTRENKSKMLRIWGNEEATAHFLNTREVIVNII